MANLAKRMADLYTEQSFWLHMQLIGKSIIEDK
jgi:hypothetical protein